MMETKPGRGPHRLHIRVHIRWLSASLAVLGLAFVLSGCFGGGGGGGGGTVTSIKVTPSAAVVFPGGTTQFQAQAYDSGGHPVEAVFSWSVTPSSLWTIDETGYFTAGSVPGTGKVICTSGSVTAQADIEVASGTIHLDEVISTDTTWTAASGPHFVVGQVTVGGGSGAALTIEPGTVVKFAPDARLNVGTEAYGALVVNGTETQRITFTSLSSTPAEGDWVGLIFGRYAQNSTIMNHCIVEYAGGWSGSGGYGDGAIQVWGNGGVGLALNIQNSTVRKSLDHGLLLGEGGRFAATAVNLTVRDCGDHLIKIESAFAHTIPTGTYLPGNGQGFLLYNNMYGPQGDVTWRKLDCDYYVEDDVWLNNNARLTLAPGVRLRMMPGTSIWVGGDWTGEGTAGFLVADGSSDRIYITSASAVPAPGNWHSIYFYEPGCSGSSLRNVTIAYGGEPYTGEESGNITVDRNNAAPGPVITGCSIEYFQQYGIVTYACTSSYGPPANAFTGNQLGEVFAH